MYARCISILLGVVAIVILVEWRTSRPRAAVQPDKTVPLSNDAALDQMIADVNFNKTPVSAALRTLARITHTNIVTTGDASVFNHWQTSPISIRFHNVSLATALFVICDLVSDQTGYTANTEAIRYGVNNGGIIVVGNMPTNEFNYSLPAQLDVSDIGDLLAMDRDMKPDQLPTEPMRIFEDTNNPPVFAFLQGDGGPPAGMLFGKQLVLYETPHQKRAIHRFIEAVRHPVDLKKPSTLPTYPVRRMARFHLDNVPAKEAFEKWRTAAGANAAYELPRSEVPADARAYYDFSTPVTVDLTDVTVEDAAAAIIDQCRGFGFSVYHEQDIVYVCPGRPPGEWCVFDITQLLAHPDRWQPDDEGLYNLKFLRPVASPYNDASAASWNNRLAVFGTPANLAESAERLKKLMSQKSPPPPPKTP